MLVCHQCNHKAAVPRICPECASDRIKFLGTGTEKLEGEVGLISPRARLLRWDRDTVREKDSHQKILDRFRAHTADILIGTQMIAKGLHLPLVTLVGVVNADISLNLPDFRSGERTFQLLSQVLGRAGRGTSAGTVVIQTYHPDHYAVQAAARHDYDLFYEREIGYRRLLRNPPFTRLACLTYVHPGEGRCQREAQRMKKRLEEEIDRKGIDDLELVGPAPAFVYRLRGRFRWQLILRGTNPSAFLSEIPVPRGWSVNIDPVSLA
jgi:primosomal protein N' (replication factor Y)